MELSDHIAQIAFALALIVALVVGLGWLVKRLNSSRFTGAGEIRVVASSYLGPKEKVVLLEVRDRQILVGVNAQNISALGDFELPESAPATPTFKRALAEAKS
jgi:flagellar protein FliO/FliZ